MADPLDPADFDDAPTTRDPADDPNRDEFQAGTLGADVTLLSNLADVQQTLAWYPENTIDVRYDYHPGVAVQVDAADGDPIQGAASPPGRVVKMHAGYWTKTVQWSFERRNAPPACPHPVSRNPNEVLIECSIVPAKPRELANNHRAWRVSGLYVYHLLSGPLGCGPFPTGASPESIATPADNEVPPIVFDDAMLDGGGAYYPK